MKNNINTESQHILLVYPLMNSIGGVSQKYMMQTSTDLLSLLLFLGGQFW